MEHLSRVSSSAVLPSFGEASTILRSHKLEDFCISDLSNPDFAYTCRICWGEEEPGKKGKGGNLISPCNCRGTSRYVHLRCLQRWQQSVAAGKGLMHATRCDICRSIYFLDDKQISLPFHQSFFPRIAHVRNAIESTLHRAMHGPAGPLIRSLSTSAWVYSALMGLYGAVDQCRKLPSVLLGARQDPFTSLGPLAVRYGLTVLCEPLVSSRDLVFHCETVFFYAAGWLLDAATQLAERTLVPELPPQYRALATGLLLFPKALGIALQALELTFVSVFGGGLGGFLLGTLDCVAAPFRALSMVARGGTAALGFAATGMTKGGRGAAMAAQLLTRVPHAA